jgi:hypothetical protein
MHTILLISPMTLGEEVAVRDLHERFPIEALERGIGVERVVAFIGSGYYALELTVSEGDFQEQFHRFLSAPEIVAFFQALRPYVRDLPNPDQHTADMPLATTMLFWQRPGSEHIPLV